MGKIQIILDGDSSWVRSSYKVMRRLFLDYCSPDAVKDKEKFKLVNVDIPNVWHHNGRMI